MSPVITEAIEKHLWAYQKRPRNCVKCVGVDKVADELGISIKAAQELIQFWINEKFS
jgi:Holliday junction resolvasome RuvABC ATP-dependent DNA helicase subunit